MDEKEYKEIIDTLQAAYNALKMTEYSVKASFQTLEAIKKIEKQLNELKEK